jgi:pimeloyl-ACP methyl ester carboxylesterase
MEKMAAKIAHAQYLCQPGVGHFAWAEQPDVFNGALLDFLARRFPAS